MMNKLEFLNGNKLERRNVTIEGLGEIVVKEIAAKDAIKLAEMHEEDESRVMATLITMCYFDLEGNKIFHAADVDAILDLKSTTLSALTLPVVDINGMNREDTEKK